MLKRLQTLWKFSAFILSIAIANNAYAKDNTNSAAMYRHYIKDQASTMICKCDIDPNLRETVPSRCLANEPEVRLTFVIQEATLERWTNGLTEVNRSAVIAQMKKDPQLLYETTQTAARLLNGTRSFALLKKWDGKRLGGCAVDVDNFESKILLPTPILAMLARSHLYALKQYNLHTTAHEKNQLLSWAKLAEPEHQEIVHNLQAAAWTGNWNEYVEPLPAGMKNEKPLTPIVRKELRDIQLALDTLIPVSPR